MLNTADGERDERGEWRDRILLALTLGMVAAGDLLLWDAPLGASAAAAAACATALACWAWPSCLADPGGKLLLAWALLSPGSLLLEPGPLGAWSCAFALIALAARGSWRGPLPLAALASFLAFPVAAPGAFLRDARASRARSREAGATATAKAPAGVLRGWFVPACIAAIFALLFGAGDAAFARALSAPLRMFDLHEFPSAGRITWWLAVLIASWGLLRARVPVAMRAGVERLAARQRAASPLVSPGLVTKTLVLVHGVFAVENVLGIRHAWLGMPLPPDIVLSDAARHGFGALVLAAALSAALVLAAYVPGGPVESDRTCRALAIAWMVQVAMVLVTAFLRLHAYVSEYSLTLARLAAGAGIGLIAAASALLLLRLLLRRDNTWLVVRISLLLVAASVAGSAADIEGAIARFNVRTFLEKGGLGTSLDVAYLRLLGPPVLPALLEARDRLGSPLVDAACAELARQAEQELADPRGFSARRQRILAAAARASRRASMSPPWLARSRASPQDAASRHSPPAPPGEPRT